MAETATRRKIRTAAIVRPTSDGPGLGSPAMSGSGLMRELGRLRRITERLTYALVAERQRAAELEQEKDRLAGEVRELRARLGTMAAGGSVAAGNGKAHAASEKRTRKHATARD